MTAALPLRERLRALAACGLLAALVLAAGCASRTLTIEGYPEAHAYLEDEAGQLQPIGKTAGDAARGRFGLRHEIMKAQRNRDLAVEVRTRDMVYRYRIVTDRDVFVLYPEPEEGFFDPVRGVQPLGSVSRGPQPEPAAAQIEPMFDEPDTTELDSTEVPMSKRVSLTLAALAFWLAPLLGCRGPALIVQTNAPAEVSILLTRDSGRETNREASSSISLGAAPVEFEVPAEFYGGKVQIKAVFEKGERTEWTKLPENEDAEDTIRTLNAPKGF